MVYICRRCSRTFRVLPQKEKSEGRGNKKTLQQHFNDHGHQFGCDTQTSYAAHAVAFANNVDRVNCVSFVDKKGSTYKYNTKTNTLAIVTKDGYVITYFKPKEGYDYYLSKKKARQR